MRHFEKWWTAQATGPGKSGGEAPIFTPAARLSLLFDALKLIGTGNGAGLLGSIAALSYFASRAAELHAPLKASAIFFILGLLVFALSIGAYISGLLIHTSFLDGYVVPHTDLSKVPLQSLNRGVDGLMLLTASLMGAALSWCCFIIGTFIGLYAVCRLA
jgi:uncharacterized membrane protein YczE